jgi:hypothetical protein
MFVHFLIAAFILAAATAAMYLWVRHLGRVRAQELRAQGYRLIHALREYSAWIDFQRDVPLTAQSLREFTSPEPLAQACRIRRECFPGLSQHMGHLLQAHTRFADYLWQQNLLRLGKGSGWQAVDEDMQYQQLRGAQEDLIDDIIALCRELIGDASLPWRSTGSDFAFTNSSIGMSLPGPAGRA